MPKVAGLDLRVFEFDYDLTWYVFLLNADETVYGRYGGRDATSAESRLSLKGLRYALTQAQEAHKAPPPVRPLAGKPVRAEEFAAASRHRGCIHCHNVNEFRRADLIAASQWDRNDVWVYPLPENIGLTLDLDVGNRVQTVRPDTPAAQAGLKPGDRVLTLNGHRVASFADATFALHKAPIQGVVPITWSRDGREQSVSLELRNGWRKTDLTWRPSMLDLVPAVPFDGTDLTADEKKRFGLAESRAAFRQAETVHSTLKAAGLQAGDVVVGFDGRVVNGTTRDLLGHVRRNYLVGDTVTVNVIRSGKQIDLRLVLK